MTNYFILAKLWNDVEDLTWFKTITHNKVLVFFPRELNRMNEVFSHFRTLHLNKESIFEWNIPSSKKFVLPKLYYIRHCILPLLLVTMTSNSNFSSLLLYARYYFSSIRNNLYDGFCYNIRLGIDKHNTTAIQFERPTQSLTFLVDVLQNWSLISTHQTNYDESRRRKWFKIGLARLNLSI